MMMKKMLENYIGWYGTNFKNLIEFFLINFMFISSLYISVKQLSLSFARWKVYLGGLAF